MEINRATDIALRVLMVLARAPGRQVSVRALAEEIVVPRHHLAKVVQGLAREGWVDTAAGRAGGVTITADGARVSAGEVVRTFEGTRPIVDCYDPPCPLLVPRCRLQRLLADAHGAFLATLDERSIAELSRI